MKLIIASFAFLSLAVGAGYWSGDANRLAALAASGIASQAPLPEYLTGEVAIGHIERSISATGSLQAVSTVEVSSQLSGQIAVLHADFNDSVIAGQPLAELDQRGYRARIEQAEAELNMARANVAILAAKLEKAQAAQLEALARRKIHSARVDQAKVKLESVARQLKRTKTLAGRGAKSRSAVEDARSLRDGAAAELRQAEGATEAHEHVIATSRAGEREAEAELANARAALPLRRAALVLARLDLDRSTIRAPIDGVIIGRNIEKGQTVATSLDAPTLFTIAGDLSALEIHAKIDETDIGEIAVGQLAEFTVDAYPGQKFPARVTEIRKAARAVQGVVAYTVVLAVVNPQGRLLPGMTANLDIVVKKIGPGRMLPLAALRFTPDGSSAVTNDSMDPNPQAAMQTVWVLKQGQTPATRNVRLGIDDGRDIAVLEGQLSAGEHVITGRVPRPAKPGLFGIRF